MITSNGQFDLEKNKITAVNITEIEHLLKKSGNTDLKGVFPRWVGMAQLSRGDKNSSTIFTLGD